MYVREADPPIPRQGDEGLSTRSCRRRARGGAHGSVAPYSGTPFARFGHGVMRTFAESRPPDAPRVGGRPRAATRTHTHLLSGNELEEQTSSRSIGKYNGWRLEARAVRRRAAGEGPASRRVRAHRCVLDGPRRGRELAPEPRVLAPMSPLEVDHRRRGEPPGPARRPHASGHPAC